MREFNKKNKTRGVREREPKKEEKKGKRVTTLKNTGKRGGKKKPTMFTRNERRVMRI